MSTSEYRGAAHAVKTFMALAADEIKAGERKGATVKFAKPNPAKTHIGWFKKQILLGQFRKRA